MDRIVYQIEERRYGSGWSAYCPELVITAFGDTQAAARAALRRQVAEYLEDCDELGLLETALIEAGFYDDGEVWMSSQVKAPEPRLRFIGRPDGIDLDPGPQRNQDGK